MWTPFRRPGSSAFSRQMPQLPQRYRHRGQICRLGGQGGEHAVQAIDGAAVLGAPGFGVYLARQQAVGDLAGGAVDVVAGAGAGLGLPQGVGGQAVDLAAPGAKVSRASTSNQVLAAVCSSTPACWARSTRSSTAKVYSSAVRFCGQFARHTGLHQRVGGSPAIRPAWRRATSRPGGRAGRGRRPGSV
jgi:hypothetical protein